MSETSLEALLDRFEASVTSGNAVDQLYAAREVVPFTADDFAGRRRALIFEARAYLAMLEMEFADSATHLVAAAEASREAGDHATELALRLTALAAQISATDDLLEVVALADKSEHLLTALEAASPPRRRHIEGLVTAAFAQLRVERFAAAESLFDRALHHSGDEIERARALGGSALCAHRRGNDQAAMSLADEAIDAARAARDDLQLVTLLRLQSGILGPDPENLSTALELAEEATERAEGLNDVLLAGSLRLRGMLRVAAGRRPEGCADLERSIKLLRPSAWQSTLTSETVTLVQTLAALGEHDEAARVVREYGDLLDRATGDDRAEIDTTRYSVAVQQEDFAAAAAYAESAAQLMADGHHKDAATFYTAASDAWTLTGDLARADAARKKATALGT